MFTEIVYRKINSTVGRSNTIQEDETAWNQWAKFRKHLEVLDEEERWIRYAEHALELLNHDVMW